MLLNEQIKVAGKWATVGNQKLLIPSLRRHLVSPRQLPNDFEHFNHRVIVKGYKALQLIGWYVSEDLNAFNS